MKKYSIVLLAISMLLSCTRENDDVVKPVVSEDFPQVILFDDEEGSVAEDSDEFGIIITLADRFDPSREELGGMKVPLDEAVTLDISFQDLEGFNDLGSYVLDVQAYEGSDENQNNDLINNFDVNSGSGQLTFPAGAEEVELLLLLDENFFSDEVENDTRGFTVSLSGTETQALQILDLPFALTVEDDEAPADE